VLDEARAAAHMPQSVFGTAAMARIVTVAQIADVMEQRGDDAEPEQALADRLGALAAALVAIHQARHGQRNVEDVLEIVIAGIAGPVAWILAAIQALAVRKRARDQSRRRSRIEFEEKAAGLAVDGSRIGRLDPIAYVVFAASRCQVPGLENDLFFELMMIVAYQRHRTNCTKGLFRGGRPAFGGHFRPTG